MAKSWWASLCTSSMEASILAGPSSRRTSSALRRRLGGRPIGRSRASRADGRFSFCRALTQTSDNVWLGEEINLLIRVVLQLLGDIYNLLFDKILLSVIVNVWLKSINNVHKWQWSGSLIASRAPQPTSSVKSGWRLPMTMVGFSRPFGTVDETSFVSWIGMSAEGVGTSWWYMRSLSRCARVSLTLTVSRRDWRGGHH